MGMVQPLEEMEELLPPSMFLLPAVLPAMSGTNLVQVQLPVAKEQNIFIKLVLLVVQVPLA